MRLTTKQKRENIAQVSMNNRHIVEVRVTHTPGPWIVNSEDTGMNDSGTIESQSGVVIAPDIYGETTAEAGHNAHLIAAAPELLAACRYVAQYHRDHDSGEGELFGLDFVTTCIAAIAKAEGR